MVWDGVILNFCKVFLVVLVCSLFLNLINVMLCFLGIKRIFLKLGNLKKKKKNNLYICKYMKDIKYVNVYFVFKFVIFFDIGLGKVLYLNKNFEDESLKRN